MKKLTKKIITKIDETSDQLFEIQKTNEDEKFFKITFMPIKN